MLVADFVTDDKCLNNPSDAITDIFSDRPKAGMFAGMKGEETSISNGSGLKRVSDSVSDQTAAGREIMMPLSTMKEAEKLCGEYLAKVASTNKKFKLSKPEVKRLIYIPCTMNGGKLESDVLSNMTPDRLGRVDTSKIGKN